ncbi:MAG TPA: pyridoxal 5'-phosphate synthase glutaminase subunit PdxT [Terriglobales bacterium]|nr:pyridoxal 5'-phosphate synthase glutaminase subunit PdxT [Terriglobales bacterium]
MSEPSIGDQLTIGVLALQGDYDAHRQTLNRLGVETVLVRKPEELERIDGLVIPGGESSTFLKFLEREGFLAKLRDFVSQKPSFGTCAGAILLAKDVVNPKQASLGVLDIAIERNAYGRQIDSSIMAAPTKLDGPPLEMVFIRAPRIERVGKQVQVLAERDGHPVLVREGKILAATFHPELSNDSRVHELFLDMVKKNRAIG